MSTTLLVLLDGWGYSEVAAHNAIYAAATPTWDRLWRDSPHTLISSSGSEVGLPDGQMGNSEVGHINIGAGRIVRQGLSRITHALSDGSFAENPAIRAAIEKAKPGALHLIGLVSPGGVHSHEDHIAAMIELALEADVKVYLHAFLDGRDTPPRSAETSLKRFDRHVASICGRYFAMDRDERWGRIKAAFEALTTGSADFQYSDAVTALKAAYARGESDEFVRPTLIHPEGTVPVMIADGDVVVFMNFRADRARQLTKAFVNDDFTYFERKKRPALADFLMLTRYAEDIDTSCAFEPESLPNTLGEYLSGLGKRQLRVAETEKYAHVTFFFSGGQEHPFNGEDRILVPSPKVSTYDLAPEMSAVQITEEIVVAIESDNYDAIICNYANGDMVGHTGIFDAAVKAVETIDASLLKILLAVKTHDGQCLITADHGNVESMRDGTTGQAHTAHTSGPVPLVYVGTNRIKFRDGGTLSDVAPTMLALMCLPQPPEMTGQSLVISKCDQPLD
jgi:2,3-bisphosphoglycerate-independent phosphoglycerate mutase